MQDEEGIWRLAIGQLFAPERTTWPERFEYRYANGTHLLQLCMHRLGEKEIKAFQEGQVHLGFYVRAETLFIIFRIQGLLDWCDQPFSLNLIPAEDRSVPPHPPGTHQLLSIVLVESETGLVRGLRAITYSKHASTLLHRILQKQLDTPFDQQQHMADIAAVYKLYPHSKHLVKAAILLERAGRND